MAYRYIAKSDGVLNDPRYRFIKAGSTVESEVELNLSWLVPAKKFRPEAEKPLMPFMQTAGSKVQHVTVPPAPISDQYTDQMKTVIAN